MAKKFVEYTGDVVTDEKDPFAKGDSGFALGTTEELNKTIGDDWWKLPLGVALGGAAVAFGKPALEKLKGSETPPIDRTRDIPMGGPSQPVVPPAQQSRTLAEAQEMASKALAGRVMNPPAPPAGAVAPQAPVQAPTLTEAVATGQSPTKAIQSDIAPLVDQAATQPTEKAAVPPAEKSVQTRVRRTKEQIAADKLAAEAASPPGFHPTYKKGAGEMGPGAYNWLHNLMGEEKAIQYWKEAVGEKNVPYKEFVENYNKSAGEGITGPVKSVTPSANAGSPKYVPNYIKGNVGIAPLAGMALMAPALLYAQKEAQKGNTAPIKELGFDVGGGAMLAKILGGPAALAAALGLGSRTLATGTLDSPEARALGVTPPR